MGGGTQRDPRKRPQNDTELVRAALGIQGPDGFVRSRDRKSKAGGGQLRKEGVRSAEEGAASWTDVAHQW